MAEEEKTIAEDLVVTKYKMAGEIVNRKCVQMNTVQWALSMQYCPCNRLADLTE